MNNKQSETETGENRGASKVNIIESEIDDPRANVDPGRTPGKAEGVEDPEKEGNE